MDGAQVKILNGNTFVVSDDRGDIEASRTDPSGLFAWDTPAPADGPADWPSFRHDPLNSGRHPGA